MSPIILNSNFSKDTYGVCFQNIQIAGADPKTFELVDADLYLSKDKNSVFIRDERQKTIHGGSFGNIPGYDKEYSKPNLFKDKYNVYELNTWEGELEFIEYTERYAPERFGQKSSFMHANIAAGIKYRLDATSFSYIGNNFFRDKNGIWLLQEDRSTRKHELIFTGVDIDSFEELEHIGYKDKYYIYFKTWSNALEVKDCVDLDTFEIINMNFAKDKNHLYDLQYFTIVKDVDIKSFEIIDDFYSKDRNHVYYRWNGTSVIKGAIPNDFEVFNRIYAKDSIGVYQNGYKLNHASSQYVYFEGDKKPNNVSPYKFEYLDGGVFKNTEFVFYSCHSGLRQIEDIDVKTFNIFNTYYNRDYGAWVVEAEDKNFLYTMYENSDFNFRDHLEYKFHLIKKKR